MNDASAAQRLDVVLDGTDRWDELEQLARDAPPELLTAVRARLANGLTPAQLVLLVPLLAALGDSGHPLLLEFLDRDSRTIVATLEALSTPETPLRYEHLAPLLRHDDGGVMSAAIGAAGFVGDPRLVDDVFAHWDSPRKIDAAMS
ncbi:MAG: hypothetical protein K0V04_46585, partial [Deltaproteobacteria bacterium]|nr:hypothetical protein [Deltaproteobacteria bacterium]